MVEKTFYIVLIVFALMTVMTSKLRRAVIYLSVFSASSAFVFILMGAPDAALAEAVLGSTLSTIVYLATLQKYRVFTMYYSDNDRKSNKEHISRKKNSVIVFLEEFCIERELEPQIIYTVENPEKIKEKAGWDLIISQKGKKAMLYGAQSNYHAVALREYVDKADKDKISVELNIEQVENEER